MSMALSTCFTVDRFTRLGGVGLPVFGWLIGIVQEIRKYSADKSAKHRCRALGRFLKDNVFNENFYSYYGCNWDCIVAVLECIPQANPLPAANQNVVHHLGYTILTACSHLLRRN
jgi:hypothetical protein